MSDHVRDTIKQNTENLMVWPAGDFDLVKYNYSTDILSVAHVFTIKLLLNYIAAYFHMKCHHLYSPEACKLLNKPFNRL